MEIVASVRSNFQSHTIALSVANIIFHLSVSFFFRLVNLMVQVTLHPYSGRQQVKKACRNITRSLVINSNITHGVNVPSSVHRRCPLSPPFSGCARCFLFLSFSLCFCVTPSGCIRDFMVRSTNVKLLEYLSCGAIFCSDLRKVIPRLLD